MNYLRAVIALCVGFLIYGYFWGTIPEAFERSFFAAVGVGAVAWDRWMME